MMDIRQKLIKDPVALEVASAGYRYLQGEDLSEDEIADWRNKARRLGEKYPILREIDPGEINDQ